MRTVHVACAVGVLAWVANGSAAPLDTPVVQMPILLSGDGNCQIESNPVFIPLGPECYAKVFECVLQVLGDYGFDIWEANRYDGRIETVPRIAPGLGLFFKPGSPVLYERLLASWQTYRHRLSVLIQPADHGGFFLEVIVRKELQDLPRPIRSTVGGAIFRNDNNVERQYEVIDLTVFDTHWIYKGRDTAMEQEIIRRLQKCI